MSPEDCAREAFNLLLSCREADRVSALQAFQRLCQQELARLWAERNDSPGHVLRENTQKIGGK